MIGIGHERQVRRDRQTGARGDFFDPDIETFEAGVSAVNPNAPPTLSRLTLMTINRRADSSIRSSQMRDPMRPHVSDSCPGEPSRQKNARCRNIGCAREGSLALASTASEMIMG
jgi:hypothetical protein